MIRSFLQRRATRRARSFSAGYQHAAALLLHGGAIDELLSQRTVWGIHHDFDRGISCAVADYQFLAGMGVLNGVTSIALTA